MPRAEYTPRRMIAERVPAVTERLTPADLDRAAALDLLAEFEVEMFEEEESDGVTPRGKPKHWHIFHIVARRRHLGVAGLRLE